MRTNLLLFFSLFLWSFTAKSQQRSDFAVELAAFDQSVPLSYFKNISGVYETYDINQIYRYHIAAATKEEADKILQNVKQSGFPSARIIDFNYIKSVCESQCGYTPPKPTGIGMRNNPNNNNNTLVNNTGTNTNNNSNNNSNSNKRSISLDATKLLGNNAVTLPEEAGDAEWLAFQDRNKDLGLTEAELLEIYKKHGNIRIDHATWFSFKNKNKDLGATEGELMELFIRHGNIKIENAVWFNFKKEKQDADADWFDFKEKNQDLGATDAELRALYAKHGNIKISNAIWFHFKNNPHDYAPVNENDMITNNPNAVGTEVQTVGFVMFEFGGTTLSNTTVPELDKVAVALVKNKNLRVELTGHADAVGNANNNYALSLRRANIVNQFLVNKGVNYSRIKVNAKGEDLPIAINNNNDGTDCPEGRKYNRRVDLKVLDPDGNEVNIVSDIKVPEHLQMH